jgi:DNA-binding protein H-NS
MTTETKLVALRAKIKKLQKQAESIESQYNKGVSQAVGVIRQFNLTLADWKRAWSLVGKKGRSKSAKKHKTKKVPIKYSDDKGNEWSGRGRTPLWLVAAQKSGKKPGDFLVKKKHANGHSVSH